ncbi:hypothetical protein VCV18_007487 [Metarhizium anisopliae]
MSSCVGRNSSKSSKYPSSRCKLYCGQLRFWKLMHAGLTLTFGSVNVATSHVESLYDKLHAVEVGETKDLSGLGEMRGSDTICHRVRENFLTVMDGNYSRHLGARVTTFDVMLLTLTVGLIDI